MASFGILFELGVYTRARPRCEYLTSTPLRAVFFSSLVGWPICTGGGEPFCSGRSCKPRLGWGAALPRVIALRDAFRAP